jgi:putative nucleotidyltransferase with HDIG domain
VTALMFGFLDNYSLPIALVGTIGGVTMAAMIGRARTAHDIWRSGLITGLAQSFAALFMGISLDWSRHEIGINTLSSFGSGLLASFIALGARPFLESFFSRTSNLRLLELADVNHPLLKKMSIEAPGTFHHSLIVASLAEDAANSIGANGLLCRVGAYFHDIGKMVKADYFIENQGTFGNPHDQVSPSLSKLVITSHVKEGMALAAASKLDQQIADFIPQHHGTSQIEYFYRKALKIEEGEEEKEEIDAEDYRYPGPKPQSRETAIVMLSDSVEAASRTLEEPNHQRYKDLVYKIVNKKLFDGQLDETTLTLKDLHTIAERFTATLTSIHHARIPYPDAQAPGAKHDVEGLTPPK